MIDTNHLLKSNIKVVNENCKIDYYFIKWKIKISH